MTTIETREETITVVVNGQPKEVTTDELSFDQVVSLASGLPKGPNIVYTVTYRRAAGHPSEGTLAPGASVKIKNGTIFNVAATDKS